ncbi:GNAT family N-acetyltransferase [Alicyclobacillus fodiniaquatilis]|jgi:ribosomal protein S18 acetylase RimI-like enzyme|uniref:GNAT family N-acetyltransferase n=1 Tax=Alicyclobacillus fodiniaquatilis TaxID=1661150 RepID=A0ABW4JPN7_9BACL
MTQDFTIRNGEVDDKSLIQKYGEIDPEWALNEGLLAVAFSDTSFHVFIAETSKEAVGYGLMRMERGSNRDAMIYVVYISKHARRQGYGMALMNHMLETAANSNCKIVRLMVNVDNVSACTLYKNLGFTERRIEMHLNLENK